MVRSKKFGIKTLIAAAAAAALIPLGTTPAGAETEHFTQEIPFSSAHPCTGEFLDGDTIVRTTITVEESTSGNMNVHFHQHTHGTQLIGEVSGDSYNFNNQEDSHYHFTTGPMGGHDFVHTVFVHHGEGLANLEEPGLDDFHQKFLVIISPGGVPTIVHQEAECR
jgi:hypothetical protein